MLYEITKPVCRIMPEERLGYAKGFNQIRNHSWFKDFRWKGENYGNDKTDNHLTYLQIYNL